MARLTLGARARGAADAFAVLVDGGAQGAVQPSAFPGPHGARVEVRDLFYATPARLKFMKVVQKQGPFLQVAFDSQAMPFRIQKRLYLPVLEIPILEANLGR